MKRRSKKKIDDGAAPLARVYRVFNWARQRGNISTRNQKLGKQSRRQYIRASQRPSNRNTTRQTWCNSEMKPSEFESCPLRVYRVSQLEKLGKRIEGRSKKGLLFFDQSFLWRATTREEWNVNIRLELKVNQWKKNQANDGRVKLSELDVVSSIVSLFWLCWPKSRRSCCISS